MPTSLSCSLMIVAMSTRCFLSLVEIVVSKPLGYPASARSALAFSTSLALALVSPPIEYFNDGGIELDAVFPRPNQTFGIKSSISIAYATA